jgi:hypothetical protein
MLQGSVLDKIIHMAENRRAAERYGTVKRLVFGYVCTFSTFAYLFESLDNLCFLFFIP